jgi:hypothetical protein
MSQIDFLPEAYRQRDVHRKNRWSRVVVVLLFVGLLAAGGFVLRKRRAAVEADLELARQDYEIMMAQTTTLAKAQATLSQSRGEANLVAYLKHPWSRARIVAAITERWPEALTLEELKIQRQMAPAGQLPVSIAASPEQSLARPPAQADLMELRRDAQQRPTVVLLSGQVTDHAVLHRYVAELAKIDLFTNVELLGITSAEKRSFQFSVRLTVAPGYGQAGGPSGPPKPREAAAPGTTAGREKPAPSVPLVAPPQLPEPSVFADVPLKTSDAEPEGFPTAVQRDEDESLGDEAAAGEERQPDATWIEDLLPPPGEVLPEEDSP